MKWFKHFSRAHEDRAVERLILEFGVRGYGLYFYCLEVITGSVDVANVSFELEPDAEILAYRLKMDTLEVERIMHRCIELGLFELSDSGRLACMKLGRFIDQSATSNAQMRQIIQEIRIKNHDSIMIQSCENHDEVKDNQEVPDQIRLDEKRIEREEEPRAARQPSEGKQENKPSSRKPSPSEPDMPPALGLLENVRLTEAQQAKVIEWYGPHVLATYIDKLSLWIPNASRKKIDHYSTILNWIRGDSIPKVPVPEPPCPYCGKPLDQGACMNGACPQYAEEAV